MICSWQGEGKGGGMSGFTHTQKPCILMPLKACRLMGKVYWVAQRLGWDIVHPFAMCKRLIQNVCEEIT